MSDTESFESIVNAAMEKVHGNYEIEAIEVAGILGTLSGAHAREIRDVSQQQYHRGFEAGKHSMDADHRAVAMRLRHLPLDGGSHENLSQIARAIWHSDFGWTQDACMWLRDELVRLMGGVSDGTAEPITTDEFIKYVEEDTRRLKGDATGTGDDSDTCACAGGGACAADCGGDSREQEKVEHERSADDCGADTGCGGDDIHMAEVSDGRTGDSCIRSHPLRSVGRNDVCVRRDSGEHSRGQEVTDERLADDCGSDTGCGDGCGDLHMAGVTYDVLDNERRKAIANLREWEPDKAFDNDKCGEIQIRLLYQLLGLGGAMMMDGADAAKKVRDRLIHLLGGDQPSGIKVMNSYEQRIEKLEKQRDDLRDERDELQAKLDAITEALDAEP